MSTDILQAKCRKPECAHVWTIAYLPINPFPRLRFANRGYGATGLQEPP